LQLDLNKKFNNCKILYVKDSNKHSLNSSVQHLLISVTRQFDQHSVKLTELDFHTTVHYKVEDLKILKRLSQLCIKYFKRVKECDTTKALLLNCYKEQKKSYKRFPDR